MQYNSCDLGWQCAAALAPSYDSRQMSRIHKAAHPLALPGSHMAEHSLAWLNDMLCAPANQATENAPPSEELNTPLAVWRRLMFASKGCSQPAWQTPSRWPPVYTDNHSFAADTSLALGLPALLDGTLSCKTESTVGDLFAGTSGLLIHKIH